MVNRNPLKLSQDELNAIEAAIVEAETQSSGEIVVSIAASSNDYSSVPWCVALSSGVLASLVLYFKHGWGMPLAEIFLIQATAFALGFFLGSFDGVKRVLISQKWMQSVVDLHALAQFSAAGLHETRHRTGILIYISELERVVEVLADRGINEKVPEDYWKVHVDKIITGIKGNQFAPSLLSVLAEVGAKLKKDFPRGENDVNELSNKVRLSRHVYRHN